MPSFSVLIHADGDAAQLGRLLETLRPADEVVVVDHHSDDAIQKVARQYGARLVPAVPGVNQGAYAVNCRYEWVLCLLASETISEALEASLFEWKRSAPEAANSFSIPVREQREKAWHTLPAETRLVNRCHVNWQGKLPPPLDAATPLAGDLLRIPATE
jgi:glycosyltransferase involved in cell wall biosynthesis